MGDYIKSVIIMGVHHLVISPHLSPLVQLSSERAYFITYTPTLSLSTILQCTIPFIACSSHYMPYQQTPNAVWESVNSDLKRSPWGMSYATSGCCSLTPPPPATPLVQQESRRGSRWQTIAGIVRLGLKRLTQYLMW